VRYKIEWSYNIGIQNKMYYGYIFSGVQKLFMHAWCVLMFQTCRYGNIEAQRSKICHEACLNSAATSLEFPRHRSVVLQIRSLKTLCRCL
jgi:hypothetical protein